MITWPAVIKYQGDDELTFISDEKEWELDPDLHFHPYTEGDVFIDASGANYNLSYNNERQMVEIVETAEVIPLERFEAVVKNHLVQLNQCCIAKFNISSFREGMEIVKKSNE